MALEHGQTLLIVAARRFDRSQTRNRAIALENEYALPPLHTRDEFREVILRLRDGRALHIAMLAMSTWRVKPSNFRNCGPQVFCTTMFGNFAEKSSALCATKTAVLRAISL